MANVITKNIKWLWEKTASRFGKRDKDLWIFGEWMGARCCDNSLYFANYVAQNHPEIKSVWICKKEADTSDLDPRVTRLEMDSTEAIEARKRAGVAVMNQGHVDFCADGGYLHDGALTVNLWHGVPWKKIGLDTLKGQSAAKKVYGNYIQRLSKSDCMLALSNSFADILVDKFCVSRKNVICAGYPRNTIFYDGDQTAKAREHILAQLRRMNGAITDDVKIITYMPTFRDKTADVFSFEQLAGDSRLIEMLEKHNAIIVQKAHFVSYQRSADANAVKTDRIVTSNTLPAMQLLAASDMLITDYSSCFFDFLLTDRPIIHYLYDYAYYANDDRGLYYTKEEVACGDTPEDTDSLLTSMEANLADPGKDAALRAKQRKTYMTYEKEGCCAEIFREIRRRQKV